MHPEKIILRIAKSKMLTRTTFQLSLLTLLLTGCNYQVGLLTNSATLLPATIPVTYPTAVPTGTHTITVNWNANHETAVNTAGGGYRVYYAVSPGYVAGVTAFVDAPYVSGLTSPITADIPNLGSATYFLNVVAYSALNTTGSAATAKTAVIP